MEDMPDPKKMEQFLSKIAKSPTWDEDPDAKTANGGVDREWQDARENDAERWIIEAREILGLQSTNPKETGMAQGTQFTGGDLADCPGCHSALGPFKATPDGKWQIICTTCGMRGPYETTTETAEQRWNSLPR